MRMRLRVMRSRLFEVIKDHEGSALVEFTLVLPVLMFLILGLAQFGLIFYNYILVMNAAATGARQLSISRLDSTAYTDTVSAINSAAGGISGLSITLSVNGTHCTTNSGTGSCQTALQNANAAGVPPQAGTGPVSYTRPSP